MLRHVHGIGYSADGKRIKISSHHGIVIYSDGKWSKVPGPAHDHMGFKVTREYLISSGHPERGSDLPNPLGLVRSQDGGRTWTSFDLHGEGDFHVVAAGHSNNALYVYNSAPNAQMPRPGIYQRLEDGAAWRSARGEGLTGEIYVLAAHPTDAGTLAAATGAGLFLSQDGGDHFTRLAAGHVTTAYFPLEGDSVWFGVFDGQPRLFITGLASSPHEEIALPAMGRNAIAYIAQNPASRSQFAFVSFERSVFITPDRGRTWNRIAAPRGMPLKR